LTDQYINIQGVKIRYRDTLGTGLVVLLTHGIGASLEMWEAQLANTDERIRLIAWDIPGHGLSDAGDQPYNPEKFAQLAWQLLDALGVEKTVLAGNSLGASISIVMAGIKPDRVTRLMLLNAATVGRESPLPFRLMTLPFLGEVMSKPGKVAIDQQINAIFHHPESISDHVKNFITRNVMRPGLQSIFLTTVRQITTLGGQRKSLVSKSLEILSSLGIEVLFIHGRHDKVIPLAHSENAHSITPNSTLLVLEDCGHTPQIELPEQITRTLVHFVSGD